VCASLVALDSRISRLRMVRCGFFDSPAQHTELAIHSPTFEIAILLPRDRAKKFGTSSDIAKMISLSWQYAAIVPLVLITLYSFITNRDRRGRKYVFPPGPKGLPIVGNSFQLPPFGASALTKKWAEQYGEMYPLQ